MKSINSKTLLKKLGKRIREIRKDQKISQAQLAFESGTSREEIYRLELGYQNVTTEVLHAIAQALDIHIKEFFDFEY